MARLLPYLAGLLFLVVGLGLVAFGAWAVFNQHNQITTFVAVPATILESTVTSRESGTKHRTTVYDEVIRYRYQVNGTWYTGDRVTPFTYSTSNHDEKYELVQRFPPGLQTTAFYDPADPSKAILLQEYSFGPYLFVLIPMISVMLGLGLIAASPPARAAVDALNLMPPAGRRGDTRVELRPGWTLTRKKRAWFWPGLLWVVVGGAALGHFFSVASRPYSWVSLIISGVYALLALVPLLAFYRVRRLEGYVDDVVLRMEREHVTLGESLDVEVEQPVKSDVLVASIDVALVCRETYRTSSGSKSSVGTRKLHNQKQTLAQQIAATPLRPAVARGRVAVPAHLPPSTPPDVRGYPRYDWSLNVRISYDGIPKYTAKFQLQVAPLAVSASASTADTSHT
jgi:hypothetical protein